MVIAGIVAEYNPFHTGHAYHLARTREALGGDCALVAVMSGNWVQQAGCAIGDKWLRARLALMGGADLVLELPTVWATASAEGFARGAVAILEGTGVVDVLSFGSEAGSAEPLEELAACLDRPDCQEEIGRLVGEGMSFPVARQEAVRAFLGCKAELLSTPNNHLGVEYIRALRRLGSAIRPMTVRREGAGHNALEADAPGEMPPRFLSATQIRSYLARGEWTKAGPYLLPGALELLEGSGAPASLERVERALLARLRAMEAEDWARLPDSGREEGLPQRLAQAGRQCASVEEFFTLAKTRRYTHARLRRLLLWAYLGLKAEDIPHVPPYLRVLGLNGRGREVLREMKGRSALPILTKPAQAKNLDRVGADLFRLESRFTDLYDLCCPKIGPPGREWTTPPVVQEGDGSLAGGG